MKTRRLLEILYYLSEHKLSSAKELSEHFDVSPRTIIRDMDQLLIAGFPIQSVSGRYGGYQFDADYALPLSRLTFEDHATLSSLVATLKLHPDSNLSVEELFNSSPWFEYDFSSWTNNDQTLFASIRHCIQYQKPFDFNYINSQGECKLRHTKPIKLLYKDRFWYLEAIDLEKGKERLYKLRRVISKKDKHDIPKDWITIEAKIASTQLFKVMDECEILSIESISKEEMKVRFACPDTLWVHDFILSFGPHCTLLSPIELKNQIILSLKQTLELY